MMAMADFPRRRRYLFYADPADPRLKRFFIRVVERITGQPYLKHLYEDNRAHPVPGESFWSAAIRRLELHLKFNERRWPRGRRPAH